MGGFTVVFTALGVGATLLGHGLLRNQDVLVRVLGGVVIVLGFSTMGMLRIPALARERRLDLARVPRGPAWAFPMGMAFAAGWAPCVGPILATILATASVAGSVWWGAILLALYSAGLGIPFVLLALGATADATIVGDTAEAAREFRGEQGGDWPMLIDERGSIAVEFGVRGVPESFLISPDGIVVTKIVGGIDDAALGAILREARGG